MGCANMCVFCNQRSISGKQCFNRDNVRDDIEKALGTISPDASVEIAYFGGSFTGIDRELMVYLLDVAKSFVDNHREDRARVDGIRLSTRPDYIDEEIIEILKSYPVRTIELGLQSMSDKVLSRSGRGHNAQCAERACKLIVESGFELVGQMMVGLPDSTLTDELETAEKICQMGAVASRIYPTVVFYGTELAKMTERGEYQMLTVEEAVYRSAKVLKVFRKHGVDCIRIGLCASDNLSDEGQVMGGANHPALGELIEGELFYEEMCELLDRADLTNGRNVRFSVPKAHLSRTIGQRGRNRQRLIEKYNLGKIIFEEKDVSQLSLTLI